jgi:hypothetical protein
MSLISAGSISLDSTFKVHVFKSVLLFVCSSVSLFFRRFVLSVLPNRLSFPLPLLPSLCSSVCLFIRLSVLPSLLSSVYRFFRLSAFPSRETLLLANGLTVRSYLVSKFLVVLGEGA